MRIKAASICSVLTGRLRSARFIEARSLAALEVGAAAVLLDDDREGDVGPLVGGEALLAGAALAAAADEVAVFRHARLHHLGVDVAAEGAFHAVMPRGVQR